MGCASSSPFVTSSGGVLTAAKGAATDAVHVGEEAIHDVKDTLNEKVGHVKDAVIGAVQNVGHGIENAFAGSVKKDNNIEDIGVMDKEITEKITNGIDSTDYKIIPLKDPNDKIIDDALDEISETYDDTVHDVKDMIRDTTDTIKDTATNLSDDVDKILSDSSPLHSTDIDSLKTTSPEPEIELALANNDTNIINPPTPKPTYSELEKLQSVNISDELSSTSERLKKNINKRIDQFKDEPIGGIYEHNHQKITDSDIELIREGVVAAAVPGVTGVLSKKETIKSKSIIRRTKMPDIKRNIQKSNIINGNISTRWEKRHDKLAQMKIIKKKFERRESSETLWSGNSGEFTKPRTMYLVFGNNFLKTPKIKIIDGNNKSTRWMKKDKLDIHELDLYTGITMDNIKDDIDKNETEQISRWRAKPLPTQLQRTLSQLRPLSQQRSILQRQSISPQRPHSQNHQNSISQEHGRIQLRPLSPFQFPRPQSKKQQKQQNLQKIPKRFQNNNERYRIIDDIDRNSDKMRKEKAAEWLRQNNNNNVMEKSFDEIPTRINRFSDLVDKRMKTTRIEKLFTNPSVVKDYNELNEQKQNSIEINNGIDDEDDDDDRKIRIDGFLDDFRELKKGKSITKFRKADEVQRFQKPFIKSNNRESFRKLDNRKMDGEKKMKFINKNRNFNRNKFINESKSFYKYD